jgi:thermitase
MLGRWKALASCVLGLLFLGMEVGALWAEWAPGEQLRPKSALGGRLPDELLVQVKAGVTESRARGILNEFGAQVSDEIPQLRVKRIKVPPQALERILESLNAHEHMSFAEPNFLAEPMSIPNDYYYNSQWHLPKISAPEGWDLTTGASDIPIAILDTGVDPSHPDLQAKLLPGYNFYDRNTDTSDVRGHGTAVAGAAAAISNNGSGVAGVAWKNPILPLRISAPDGYATYSAMASAITYAADHGAKVINLSYGGENYSSTLQSAVDYAWSKGAVVVASAANYSTDTPYYPAACNHVVAVSATNTSDQLTTFSNYGNWVDVAAPGVSIYTTSRGGGYGAYSGTSFSSPVTAGLLALIFSANPSLTNQDVLDILTQNTDDLGAPGFDSTFAHGRINVSKSLKAALEKRQETDTTPPLAIITSPSDGSVITGGAITVSVSATDNVGVTKVELYVNGSLHSTDTSSPYSFLWDSSQRPDGTYQFYAKAYDAAGNTAQSGSISLNLARPQTDITPPVVSISSPSDGSVITGGAITVSVSATDNVGVTKVELYVNGSLHSTDTSSPYSFLWDSSQRPDGTYQFYAKAYDAAGNTAQSGSITLSLARPQTDTTPPVVSISSPSDGSVITGGAITVSVSATDNVGVTKVELYVNGSLHSTDTSSPYSFLWDSSQRPDGTYQFYAKAYDAAGNTAQSGSISLNLTRPQTDITPPVVSISSPKEGQRFRRKLRIQVSALDDSGISRIDLLLDGIALATEASESMNYVLKGSGLPKGEHTITFEAEDLAGNISTAQVTVYKGRKPKLSQ